MGMLSAARYTNVEAAIGLALALVSTTLVNLAYVREHDAVGELPPLSLSRPLRSLQLLLADRGWLGAFAMESGGFILYVAAVRLAPLALVQSITAGGIGVLAVATARLGHRTLTTVERVGAVVSIAGLLFLSLSLAGGVQQGARGDLVEIGLWLGCTSAAALLVLVVGRSLVGAALADAVAGGLLFSCGDISTKIATEGGARVLFAIVAIFGYALGSSLLQIGYQRGTALSIAGVATLLTSALPIAAGSVLLHETPPHGAQGVLRVVSFAAVVIGAILLGRPRVRAHGEGVEHA
jgi:drug/metabolite transporter (DMT)-like permease